MEELPHNRRNFIANSARPAGRIILCLAELGLPIKLRQEVFDSRDHLIDALEANAKEAIKPKEIDDL